ncbi:MAG: alpha/beta hydrolase [Bacillota bacterium]
MGMACFTIKGEGDIDIYIHKWIPDQETEIKGAVQIIHGMTEHAGRYKGFAERLAKEGYIVYGDDHRGHGKTVGCPEKVGHLSPDGDWDHMIDDVHRLTVKIKEENPKMPVFLFAHSMGSFIGRNYLSLFGDEIQGAVLCGTGLRNNILLNVGLVLAKLEMRMKGCHVPSKFLDRLSFGNYNDKMMPRRSLYDWLSRDEDEVEKYIHDPYCGAVCTSGFFYNLFYGIREIQKKENIHGIPKQLPIFLIAGDMDPVGNYGKDIHRLADVYKEAGIRDVTYKLYKDARHELLNEINREEVIRDVINWYHDKLKQ